MGWPLMVGINAIESENTCIEFDSAWGHGSCSDFTGWSCFFLPINNQKSFIKPKKIVKLDADRQITRRNVRRDYMYDKPFKDHRYPRLSKIYPNIGPTSDLLAWGLVFRWIYRLQPSVRKKVDEIKAKIILPKNYAALHIRLGDKVEEKNNIYSVRRNNNSKETRP